LASSPTPSAAAREREQEPEQPTFFYDLGSPECYLAAERIMSELPIAPEWEPVLSADLADAGPRPDLEQLARLIEKRGLQPLRWPESWPMDTRTAMLAATYAKRVGRAVAFSLAAFRQAFAGGRNLADENTVLIAAAACEMHPTALLKGISLRSVVRSLELAGARANAAGAHSLPAIQVGERLFEGHRAIELAAAELTVAG
jgi:2-hydroxychromene-2-carboxylate isomerase